MLASAADVIGLASSPARVRERGVGRAPYPRALGRRIGAPNPHGRTAAHSGKKPRVLRCGVHARQLLSSRPTGSVGVGPREGGVVHEHVGAGWQGRRAGRRRRRRRRRRRARRRRRRRHGRRPHGRRRQRRRRCPTDHRHLRASRHAEASQSSGYAGLLRALH